MEPTPYDRDNSSEAARLLQTRRGTGAGHEVGTTCTASAVKCSTNAQLQVFYGSNAGQITRHTHVLCEPLQLCSSVGGPSDCAGAGKVQHWLRPLCMTVRRAVACVLLIERKKLNVCQQRECRMERECDSFRPDQRVASHDTYSVRAWQTLHV